MTRPTAAEFLAWLTALETPGKSELERQLLKSNLLHAYKAGLEPEQIRAAVERPQLTLVPWGET
jgi:hypothetical protein